MAEHKQKLAGELPTFDRDDWLSLVNKALRGSEFESELVSSTRDGLTVKPLYTLEDDLGADHAGVPAFAPLTRGRRDAPSKPAWDVCQIYAESDPDVANKAIRDDLDQGVTSLLAKIAAPEQNGIEIRSLDDIKRLLVGVDVGEVQLALQAGARSFEISDLLVKYCQEPDLAAKQPRFALNADPLGTLARDGGLELNLDQAFDKLKALFEQIGNNFSGSKILLADGRPYHNAGATEAQEIASVAATLVAYLRGLESYGLSPQHILERSAVFMTADTDQFLTIAKLRAVRRVVWRLADACNAGEVAKTIPLNVQTSERMMAGRDIHVNMLRTTVACAGAVLGGADSITVLPYTSALGLADAFARRIARNTHAVLRDESALGRVLDPAGGSWYVEQLTDNLSNEAWRIFQGIESNGGLVSALQNGYLQGIIRETATERERDLSISELELTGVSAFPDLFEAAIKVEPHPHPEELEDPAITVEPMPLRRLSEPFERLRDASDATLTQQGKRPKVFLATLGQRSDFNDRASYAKNFFAAGGIDATISDGYDTVKAASDGFGESNAQIVCLCSSDGVYKSMAEDTASALRASGAKHIYLVGRPGEMRQAFKQAGIETFLHKGCDMLATLKNVHDILGIAA